MPKKLTDKEREKFAQKVIEAASSDLDSLLGPPKKSRKSLKTPIEKLNSYDSIINDSFCWASRQSYLEIVQSFLLKKIDADIFISKFLDLRFEDRNRKDELCAIIEDRIRPIPDLYYTSKATDFAFILDTLYFEIDLYDPDIPDIDDSDWIENETFYNKSNFYNEDKLRSVIQERFVPEFQHSCDLNDSFFRPQMDLD
jgi:hypothetical protein